MQKIKLGIVSTTINGESGYLSFDRLVAENQAIDACFYISGDLNSKPFDSSKFLSPVCYLSPQDQMRFHCSEEIGWNKIMRRNLATLRCIEDLPDYILTIDDDNEPSPDYFDNWVKVLSADVVREVAEFEAAEAQPWHNYLASSDSPVEIYPRGFPIEKRGKSTTFVRDLQPGSVDNEDVWLYQGISLGDPDIDAFTRISVGPDISRVDEIDYVMRDIWSPFNTQNTLIARPLFLLAFVWPNCGRFDDIFASFIWQQFIFNNRKYVHIGNAVNKQIKRPRNLIKDLSAEVEGYQECQRVIAAIRQIDAIDPINFIDELIGLSEPELLTRHRRFFRALKKDLAGKIS